MAGLPAIIRAERMGSVDARLRRRRTTAHNRMRRNRLGDLPPGMSRASASRRVVGRSPSEPRQARRKRSGNACGGAGRSGGGRTDAGRRSCPDVCGRMEAGRPEERREWPSSSSTAPNRAPNQAPHRGGIYTLPRSRGRRDGNSRRPETSARMADSPRSRISGHDRVAAWIKSPSRHSRAGSEPQEDLSWAARRPNPPS